MRKIKNLGEKLAVIPLLFALYGVMYLLDTTCIVKSALGFPCPGCGMTRAVVSALKLEFTSAFTLHPMFWSVPILGLYFLYDGRLFENKHINRAVLISLGAGFVFVWIMRLIN